jgi:hypothetical protein
MTSNKTEEIRFKNDRCSQPDQIENISGQKSVSQEMAHIVYQLVVLISSPPSRKTLMRSYQLSLAHYMITAQWNEK